VKSNERYGLFVDWKLLKDFPPTLDGFHEALQLSKSLPVSEDGEHEIKVFTKDGYTEKR